MRLDCTERLAFLAGALLFVLGFAGAVEARRVAHSFDCRAFLVQFHGRDLQLWQERLCAEQFGHGWRRFIP